MAKLNVNGNVLEVEVEPTTPLLWVLREQLGLTGSKYGCGIAQCGSCTVHLDGVPMRSCSLPVSAVSESQKVVTIEGLSADGSHPVQKACPPPALCATAACLRGGNRALRNQNAHRQIFCLQTRLTARLRRLQTWTWR